MTDADDIPGLVWAWDERLRRDASRFEVFAPEAVASGTFLREPATDGQVAAAEQRLGVEFTPSYRAFLLTSNGAWASSLGPEKQHWGRTNRHGFLPADEIRPLAEVEPFRIEIWTSESVFLDPDADNPPEGDQVAEVRYFAPMRGALVISRPLDIFMDLLVPRPGAEEWEVWKLYKEGAAAYRSFAAFLRAQLAKPDTRPKPELADSYAAEVRAGVRHRLNDLAELGDPRTGELALSYLLDPSVTEVFKRGWAAPVGKVGDPEFVPVLRGILREATMDDFRMELLAALHACGDPDLDATLDAIAADPTDKARRFAGLLREHRRRGA